jgi:hypothetical protein
MRCKQKAQRPKKTIEGQLALTPTFNDPRHDTATHTPSCSFLHPAWETGLARCLPGDLPAFSHFVPIYSTLPLVSFLFLIKVKAGQHAFSLFLIVVSKSFFQFFILWRGVSGALADQKKNSFLLRFVRGRERGLVASTFLSPPCWFRRLVALCFASSEQREKEEEWFSLLTAEEEGGGGGKDAKSSCLLEKRRNAFSFFPFDSQNVVLEIAQFSPFLLLYLHPSFLRPSAR